MSQTLGRFHINQVKANTELQLQHRGRVGSLTIDTDEHVVRLHDSVTFGGHPTFRLQEAIELFTQNAGNSFELLQNTPAIDLNVRACCLSPNGQYLAIAFLNPEYLLVFNTADWSTINIGGQIPNTAHSLDFSPDSSILVVGHDSNPYATFFNTNDWSIIAMSTPSPDSVNGCSFNNDGSLVALVHFTEGGSYLTVLDTQTWTSLSEPYYGTMGECCAFSPDGSLLAICGSNGFDVLDVNQDWQTMSNLPQIESYNRYCAFSPDGSLLAICGDYSSENNLYILNTSDWSIVSNTPQISSELQNCNWSSDGQYLAVNNVVYNTSTWDIVLEAPLDNSQALSKNCFSDELLVITNVDNDGKKLGVYRL